MKPSFLLAAAVSLLPVSARSAQSAAPPAMLSAAGCDGLRAFTLAPGAIGLPTGGARILTAVSVAASAQPAHCAVTGEIVPVDPKAPPITFQVILPATWNGKVLGLGGGGWNGVLWPMTPSRFEPTNAPSALARGYALFLSDSGHTDHPATTGDFMLNDEARNNYLGDALKKTRDTAVALVRYAYGRAPGRSYFVGSSTGGREALWVAGRWPADWDGVVAMYPARDLTMQVLGAQILNRAFAAPGAFVPPAKRELLLGAALEACDGMDGVKDGLISDVRGCNARFNPARATYRGKPLRCASGGEEATCLSDRQLAALRTMQSPARFGLTLANGVKGFPGYNAYTSDLGIATTTPLDQALTVFGLGMIAPGYPAKPGMSVHLSYADAFIRYGWVRDPAFNALTFDPQRPGRFSDRILELSKVDKTDADLSAFAARGGKVLLLHGQSDMIVSARVTEDYYARLRRQMGAGRVNRFLRFYEVPGFSHGFGKAFDADWDFLTSLEGWVENGKDPGDSQIITDKAAASRRTRPLCRFPTWPRYMGTGDVNVAASFICSADRR